MKIVVTHTSPDWDAITSVWLIKRFLDGWEDATVKFVPAGNRLDRGAQNKNVIEIAEGNEIIHVDTGLGPLDHHQTSDRTVCGASLTWDYVKMQNEKFTPDNDRLQQKIQAIDRMVKVVVAVDHFREVFWPEAAADYHEFSLLGLLEGLKLQKQDADLEYVTEGMGWLDAMLRNFESRVWAEREIKEKGIIFETRLGKGLAIETLNDAVLKLAQKMGYVVVIRKDPRKGYVRIKARPEESLVASEKEKNIDLTLVYEKLQKMDPSAMWFLHVSKKMLLNGGTKNPVMRASKLSLEQLMNVVKQI